nr:Peptidase M12A domain containing protein [Haemonchus contortus]
MQHYYSEQAEEIVEGIEEQVDGVSRTKRQAFKDHRYPRMTWSEGVNYYFHDSATTDRIMVFPQQGCWSFVGKVGGEQNLSLGAGCDSVATAAHEIGHALGLLHTMSRYDRDDYITLNTVNIKFPKVRLYLLHRLPKPQPKIQAISALTEAVFALH